MIFVVRRLLEPFLAPFCRLNWSFLSSVSHVLRCSASLFLFNGTKCSKSPSSAGINLVSWCPCWSGLPRAVKMVERRRSRGLVPEKVLDALFQHLLDDLGLPHTDSVTCKKNHWLSSGPANFLIARLRHLLLVAFLLAPLELVIRQEHVPRHICYEQMPKPQTHTQH